MKSNTTQHHGRVINGERTKAIITQTTNKNWTYFKWAAMLFASTKATYILLFWYYVTQWTDCNSYFLPDLMTPFTNSLSLLLMAALISSSSNFKVEKLLFSFPCSTVLRKSMINGTVPKKLGNHADTFSLLLLYKMLVHFLPNCVKHCFGFPLMHLCFMLSQGKKFCDSTIIQN